MAKSIAIANQKGGIGKTTTAICIADGLKKAGYKVLYIDCDPQCNSTKYFGAETEGQNTLYDLYYGNCGMEELVQQTDMMDVIPNDEALAGKEPELGTGVKSVRNYQLIQKIKEFYDDRYDFIIMDTPPNLGLFMSGAMLAADRVIVPITAERFAVDGLGLILNTIQNAKELNGNLEIMGVLMTRFDVRNKLDRDTFENLPAASEALGVPCFDITIRKCQDIAKSQAEGVSIFDRYASSNAASDYAQLVKYIVENA